MPTCHLIRPANNGPAPRFYRIEICANLFGEFSVLREWGQCGHLGARKMSLFTDLRAASRAADRARNRMLRRGYSRN